MTVLQGNEKRTETVLTSSPEETEAFAAKTARSLPWGTVIAMHGNLGAGKTVFARGFARALGIVEPVSSPTFTLVQEYPCPDGNGILYHLDLYRINNSDAALAFGVDEFLYAPDAMTLLEWPERIADILPETALHLTIEHTDNPDLRRLTLVYPEGTNGKD